MENNHDSVRLNYRCKQENVLFNDAFNTFYLWIYGVSGTRNSFYLIMRLCGIRHMVKDHSDSERGNLLPSQWLLFLINSKGSFICTIQKTG